MSAGLIFASEVGSGVAQASLSDDVLDIMESKFDAAFGKHDPAVTATPTVAPAPTGGVA